MKKLFQFIVSVLFEAIVVTIIVKVIQKIRKAKRAERTKIFEGIGQDEGVDPFDPDA